MYRKQNELKELRHTCVIPYYMNVLGTLINANYHYEIFQDEKYVTI